MMSNVSGMQGLQITIRNVSKDSGQTDFFFKCKNVTLIGRQASLLEKLTKIH